MENNTNCCLHNAQGVVKIINIDLCESYRNILSEIGLRVGATVLVVQNSWYTTIKLENRRYAIDNMISKNVYVEVLVSS